VVGVLCLAILSAGCSGRPSVPDGYHRIGAAGSDVLYARVAHENDGDYVAVLVRTGSGDTVCVGRGPLMADKTPGAVCDGGSPDVYVFVTQTAKGDPSPRLCREDGGTVAVTRLRTDETWPADFVVSVDRSGAQFPVVIPCAALRSG
jgi:hypothetical protein